MDGNDKYRPLADVWKVGKLTLKLTTASKEMNIHDKDIVEDIRDYIEVHAEEQRTAQHQIVFCFCRKLLRIIDGLVEKKDGW